MMDPDPELKSLWAVNCVITLEIQVVHEWLEEWNKVEFLSELAFVGWFWQPRV